MEETDGLRAFILENLFALLSASLFIQQSFINNLEPKATTTTTQPASAITHGNKIKLHIFLSFSPFIVKNHKNYPKK